MITGVVRPSLEAVLQLSVHDAGGKTHDIEAVVDTGFNGFLTLPPALITQLGLAWLSSQQGELADGSLRIFDVFAATIIWEGKARQVEVEALGASPLIGMNLLRNYELRIHVAVGGAVIVSAIP